MARGAVGGTKRPGDRGQRVFFVRDPSIVHESPEIAAVPSRQGGDPSAEDGPEAVPRLAGGIGGVRPDVVGLLELISRGYGSRQQGPGGSGSASSRGKRREPRVDPEALGFVADGRERNVPAFDYALLPNQLFGPGERRST